MQKDNDQSQTFQKLRTYSQTNQRSLQRFKSMMKNIIPSVFNDPLKTCEFIFKQKAGKDENKSDNNYFFSHFATPNIHPVPITEADVIGYCQLIIGKYIQGSSTDAVEINKLSQFVYQKGTTIKASYIPVWGKALQTIQIVIDIQQKQKEVIDPNSNIDVFVIHHPLKTEQSQKVTPVGWIQLIERYRINSGKMKYVGVCSAKLESGMFNVGGKSKQALLRKFVTDQFSKQRVLGIFSHINNTQQILKINEQRNGKESDPAFSDKHVRILSLSPEHYQLFENIKKFMPQVSDNIICRYLLANDYDSVKAKNGIQEFQKWEKQVQQRHKDEDFEFHMNENYFKYIGEDKFGRPIIYIDAGNAKMQNYNQQKFIDTTFKFVEVQNRKNIRGFVDTSYIIIDARKLCMQNMKVTMITKAIVAILKYCPEKQCHIIAVNCNNFTYYCWKIIKPVVPSRTQSKIQLFGSSKNEYLPILLENLSQEVIPVHLGGKNNLVE